ncbi:general substrate transporter [Parathielavia appendiculata]|uniref:General substrate transporter n=1 Tax=Parathielavia appendiculata TaxID=2587402 RepID=A0AAN6Z0S7_9PEZI|nr:general substrate transporter [Parathielavia appendiculata]
MNARVVEGDLIEAEPLLTAEERDSIDIADETTRSADPDSGHNQRYGRRAFAARFQAKKRKTIIALLTLLMFTLSTSGMLILIPIFRLMEDAVCHIHYEKSRAEPIDERLCKVDSVQKELAYLGGISAMLNSIVGLIATLPYGVLADRIGRKPSFILAYIGTFLVFSWGPLMLVVGNHVRLAPLGSVFFLLGGGIPVAMNSLNAMVSDISSEADRATGFLCLSFGAVLGGLIGPVTAGLLMENLGPWSPIILVYCITPFVFLLVLFLPETLPIKLRDATDDQEERSLSEKLRGEIKELAVSLALLKNRNIALTLPAFLIQPVLFAAYSSTLSQHISTYFGWSLAQTSYLLSPLSILQLVIIVLLPKSSGFLTNPSGRLRLSVFSKDLLLTRLSLLFLIAGALVEGFSREIVLFLVGLTVGTFGSSHGPFCRAVTTSYVDPQQTSRLYALISMLETGSALLGGPVLAVCFNVGLSKRGLWTGLPWFYVATLVLIPFACLAFLREPKKTSNVPDSEGEDNGNLGYQSGEEHD